MLAAVSPSSDGFGGGLRAPGSSPTDVNGGGFGTPGSAAAPPGVPTSGVIEARNNRGSNVLLPYARLVPLHAKSDGRPDLNDVRVVNINGVGTLEYENLRAGELAWILGRRIKETSASTQLEDSSRYTHQAVHVGLGHGVDRMQRLASTDWMESYVSERLSDKSLSCTPSTPAAQLDSMDPHLAHMKPFIAGSRCCTLPTSPTRMQR